MISTAAIIARSGRRPLGLRQQAGVAVLSFFRHEAAGVGAEWRKMARNGTEWHKMAVPYFG
jgi:hypothetical protein